MAAPGQPLPLQGKRNVPQQHRDAGPERDDSENGGPDKLRRVEVSAPAGLDHSAGRSPHHPTPTGLHVQTIDHGAPPCVVTMIRLLLTGQIAKKQPREAQNPREPAEFLPGTRCRVSPACPEKTRSAKRRPRWRRSRHKPRACGGIAGGQTPVPPARHPPIWHRRHHSTAARSGHG